MKRLGIKNGDVIFIKVAGDTWEANDEFDRIKNILESCDNGYKVMRISENVEISVVGKPILKLEDEFVEEL